MAVPVMPTTAQYGYVVGRFLIAIGDTSADPDNYPDPVVPSGNVTLTPVAGYNLFPTSNPPVTVLPKAVTLTLDADGDITDNSGNQGVWVVTGQYDVSFNFVGMSIDGFRINITSAYTAMNPADLTLLAPIPVSPASIFVVNTQVYTDTLAARDAALAAVANIPNTTNLATNSSPTFTGIPLAPTAAAGTNTQQIATVAFVGTAIANLIGSAPGVLDTLSELATALGNDPNFTTTITTTLATKAPIASPTFTGVPFAATAATATNNTQIATTAFVRAAITAYGSTAVVDASSTTKGVIQLAGDLAGTAATPTVPGLAAKAPSASPTLTGVPLTPTPTAGDNSTKIASTAFVRGEMGDPATDLSTYFTSVLPA